MLKHWCIVKGCGASQSRAELDSAHAAKRQLDDVQRQLAELERDLCRGHPTVHSRT